MNGLFVRPTGTGWEVIKVDGGHYPMDYFRHRTQALSYAIKMSAELTLPVFEEIRR